MGAARTEAAMSEAQRQGAYARFQLLRPYLEDGIPLAVLVRQHRLALRTAHRWLEQYRSDGLVGLARQPKSDRGQQRGVTADLRLLIEGLALQTPRPTCATIQRRVAAVALAHAWRVPSYHQVRTTVHALDSALLMLAHQGLNVYKETAFRPGCPLSRRAGTGCPAHAARYGGTAAPCHGGMSSFSPCWDRVPCAGETAASSDRGEARRPAAGTAQPVAAGRVVYSPGVAPPHVTLSGVPIRASGHQAVRSGVPPQPMHICGKET